MSHGGLLNDITSSNPSVSERTPVEMRWPSSNARWYSWVGRSAGPADVVVFPPDSLEVFLHGPLADPEIASESGPGRFSGDSP